MSRRTIAFKRGGIENTRRIRSLSFFISGFLIFSLYVGDPIMQITFFFFFLSYSNDSRSFIGTPVLPFQFASYDFKLFNIRDGPNFSLV